MRILRKAVWLALATMLLVVPLLACPALSFADSPTFEKSYIDKDITVDTTVKYPGSDYSIKITNKNYDYFFASKTFKVKPHTDYRATVMAKCEGYELMSGKQCDYGCSMGQALQYSSSNTN